MKDLRKREIRRILMGYIAFDEDQHILASERSSHLRLMGLLNGSTGARVLGLGVRTRHYVLTASPEESLEECGNAFAELGRFVELDSDPELLAVFYSPIFYNPAILTAQVQDGNLVLTVYTARSLTVRWNTAHAFRQWRQRMPEGLRERELAEKSKGKKKKKEKNARKLRRHQNSGAPANAEPEATLVSDPEMAQTLDVEAEFPEAADDPEETAEFIVDANEEEQE